MKSVEINAKPATGSPFGGRQEPALFALRGVRLLLVALLLGSGTGAGADTTPLPELSPDIGGADLAKTLIANTALTDAASGSGGALVLERGTTAAEFPAQVVLARDTEVRVAVTAFSARVTLSQIFTNHSNETLHGEYRFALPPNVAVDRMRLELGDRLIEGEIREKAAAKREFDTAKAAGQRASLVSQSHSNLFAAAVANFMPGETLVVSLEYQQQLAPIDGALELRLPLAQTPRYGAMPAGGGGQAQTPRLEAVASLGYPTLKMQASIAGFDIDAVQSPSHALCQSSADQGIWQVGLCDGAHADRDLILRWQMAQTDESAADFLVQHGRTRRGDAVHGAQDNNSYGLVAFMPPPPARARVEARELVLVIDTSGSMAGESLAQAKAALLQALASLSEEDSVNVIAFSDTAQALWAGSQPVTHRTLSKATQFVRSLEADGGTEMAAALRLALQSTYEDSTTDVHRQSSSPRLRQVLFITDGAVNGEDELYQLITKHLGSARLFPVAIGAAPNGYFMARAAAAGKGVFTFIGHGGEVEEKMTALLTRIAYPVVTGLALRWENGDAVQTALTALPDLYAGEPLMLSIKEAGSIDKAIIVSGSSDGEVWQRRLVPRRVPLDSGLDALFGAERIAHLASEPLTMAQRREQTLALGLEYHLVTPFTSLIAVDKTPVGSGAGLNTLFADPLPHGWQGGRLPQTGDGSAALLLWGVILLLSGTGAAILQRRRQYALD